jgi:glycosyltransferase involved in cell wall biosynthesis
VSKKRILVLEPYYGGSHKRFVDTLVRATDHEMTLWTMPARKWKWRIRGAAIWFARMLKSEEQAFDVILANDMLSVADLRALAPRHHRDTHVLTYFHENQLTYPVPDENLRDYQYGFTNITSCLASEAVWFNSESHLTAFLLAAESLLRRMPDFQPLEVVDSIRQKARVMHPMIEVAEDSVSAESGELDLASGGGRIPNSESRRPVILWNHRWEYDKAPEEFFEVLVELDDDGVEFELILLGQAFRLAPPIFDFARNRLASRIRHWGYVPDRKSYLKMLRQADFVVSTAIQENFGIAMVEAMLEGCLPVAPNRLSYPEIIPTFLHGKCLYKSGMLKERLVELFEESARNPDREIIADATKQRFGSVALKPLYDKALADG